MTAPRVTQAETILRKCMDELQTRMGTINGLLKRSQHGMALNHALRALSYAVIEIASARTHYRGTADPAIDDHDGDAHENELSSACEDAERHQ